MTRVGKAADHLLSELSFFTCLPVGNRQYTLETVASGFYTLPVVGLVTGGVFALAMFTSLTQFPPLVSSTLGALALILVTRGNEFDGLVDFADGLMCVGSPEERLRAARDTAVGAGGVAAGGIFLILQVVSLAEVPKEHVVQAALGFELVGKLSLVFLSMISSPASGSSAAAFVGHVRTRKGAIGASIAVLVSYAVLFALNGALVSTILVVLSLGISGVFSIGSRRAFGGVSGDVFGALNEVAGVCSLLVFLMR